MLGGGGGYNIFYKDYYAYGQVMAMGMSWAWATAWVEARLGLVAKTGKHARINNHSRSMCCTIHISANNSILGLWLRLECSLDSLSIDSAHVIYVSEGYDVAYNRRTASQPSHVVLRVTWYVKTFQKRKLRVLNPARINVFYWFNWLNLIGS